MSLRAGLAAVMLWAAMAQTAAADVLVWIDISEQEMKVARDGQGLYQWPVSTGRPGKRTPTGVFTAQWLDADHKSSIYDNAPMPWSIFFIGGVAIHGTDQIASLGQPVSGGCVRLHPDHAKTLYAMVAEDGLANTTIVVVR